jgi:deoxycytidylate deaminase
MPVLGVIGPHDLAENFITLLTTNYEFLPCRISNQNDRRVQGEQERTIWFDNLKAAEGFWLKRPSNEYYIIHITELQNSEEALKMFVKRTLFLLINIRRKNDLIDPKLLDLIGFSIIFDVDDEKERREKLEILASNLSMNKLVWYRPDWDTYFMEMARLASLRSNCSKRRIGCILVFNSSVVATGYNGTPRSFVNCFDGGCPRCISLCSVGTDLACCLCVHAEENALLEAGRSRATGSTLYCTTAPCLQCCKKIVQCGVKRVVYAQEYSVQHDCREVLGVAKIEIDKYCYRSKVYFLSEQTANIQIACASIDDTPSADDLAKDFEAISCSKKE